MRGGSTAQHISINFRSDRGSLVRNIAKREMGTHSVVLPICARIEQYIVSDREDKARLLSLLKGLAGCLPKHYASIADNDPNGYDRYLEPLRAIFTDRLFLLAKTENQSLALDIVVSGLQFIGYVPRSVSGNEILLLLRKSDYASRVIEKAGVFVPQKF